MGHLIVFLLHLIWRKLSGGAPMPAPRLPGGKTLPTINPWQLAILTWLLNKLWGRYGDDVKARVASVEHPAVKRVRDFWHKPTNPAPAATPAAATAAATPTAGPQPAQVAPAVAVSTEPTPPKPTSIFEPVEIGPPAHAQPAAEAHQTGTDNGSQGDGTFLSPRGQTRTLPGGAIFVSLRTTSQPGNG